MDPEKGLVRPWPRPQPRELESPENQSLQKHGPLEPEGSASQTCSLTACILFSPMRGGKSLPSCSPIMVAVGELVGR